MALNIKNAEVERLVDEVAALTGETKTEAVRRALEERRARLRTRVADHARSDRIRRFLQRRSGRKCPARSAAGRPNGRSGNASWATGRRARDRGLVGAASCPHCLPSVGRLIAAARG
jgi:antitoxin VapB